jgi:hypothetical protein
MVAAGCCWRDDTHCPGGRRLEPIGEAFMLGSHPAVFTLDSEEQAPWPMQAKIRKGRILRHDNVAVGTWWQYYAWGPSGPLHVEIG